jgi:hypothetical protein
MEITSPASGSPSAGNANPDQGSIERILRPGARRSSEGTQFVSAAAFDAEPRDVAESEITRR